MLDFIAMAQLTLVLMTAVNSIGIAYLIVWS